jgi:hypothetical protein
MADEADVTAVLDLLPSTSAEQGWDQDRVGTDLDSGMSPNQIALAYYRKRAADSATYVDISESGSSRSLSTVHRQMVAMVEMYQKLVNLEDTEDNVDDPPPTRGPGIRTFSIRRIART